MTLSKKLALSDGKGGLFEQEEDDEALSLSQPKQSCVPPGGKLFTNEKVICTLKLYKMRVKEYQRALLKAKKKWTEYLEKKSSKENVRKK